MNRARRRGRREACLGCENATEIESGAEFVDDEVGLVGEGVVEAGVHPGFAAAVCYFEVVLQRVGALGVFGGDGSCERVAGTGGRDRLPALGLADMAVEESDGVDGGNTFAAFCFEREAE